MSKRTLTLIIVLILVSAILIYTAAFQGQQKPASQVVKKPVIVAHTILSMSPSVSTTSKSIDITINTMGDNVTAAQAEIAYDPTLVRNVHVVQGTFFTNPIVLFNLVDQKNGRISYAIGIQPQNQPQKGSGAVATITYDQIPGTKGTIAFTFLPKTKVTAEGIDQSVLKTANSVNITLPTGSNY